MPLKFWLGGAKSDKSRRLIKYILDEAEKNPSRQYLFVVPEQFGLATQQELVGCSKNKGILNIDVLSFTRLAHRISDEVGSYGTDITLLDEMGKSLIIGMLAQKHKDELEVFGENIDKLGYIDKIKSVISEFMQYMITAEKAKELAEAAEAAGKGLLAGKLKDTALLYGLFLDYIKDRYTTVEETLDTVSRIVPHSETVKNSVVIFDGFTGFTPVQYKLIGVLMDHAIDMHVALLLEDCIQDNAKEPELREHELFYLSKTTINRLQRMADERFIPTEELKAPDKYEISNACDSKGEIVYTNDNTSAKFDNTVVKTIVRARDPYDEVDDVIGKIRHLIINEGYRYKDVAILTGDTEGYRHIIEREFTKHDIPFFIDRTEPVLLNPFIEYIRAFIGIFTDDFSVRSVFRFLKSGLGGFDEREVNLLENYCLATGIKGRAKWHKDFTTLTDSIDADKILALNEVRKRLIAMTDSFEADLQNNTVKQFCTALYLRIEADGIEDSLRKASKRFEEAGNRKYAGQYARIYIKIMDILDGLCALIPDEMTDISAFGKLLDAGLDAIRIGTAPTGMDYVHVGDLTRSRFDDIRALFIIGANDGIIPMNTEKAGLINDRERDFLTGSTEGLALAPTSREEIYTQQLYIYMAVNKPTERLYVSYSGMDTSGKALLPSYIIAKLRKENPDVIMQTASAGSHLTPDDPDYPDEKAAFTDLTSLIYSALSGTISPEGLERLKDLIRYFLGSERYKPRLMKIFEEQILRAGCDAGDTIGAALAHAIYGRNIQTSITRLEAYANCAYRYFLEYGLKIRDREIFSVDARDIGNIFHESMKVYSELMREGGHDWADTPEDVRENLMDEAVDRILGYYLPKKLSSSARYAYMQNRIRRVMKRSADIVSAQVARGKFVPKYFEVDFDTIESMDQLQIRLSDEDVMRLRGRIDRVDTCETEEGVFIRIIDYKSSLHKMDLAAVYEGRQLQLLVYLNVAMEGERRSRAKSQDNANVCPAGVLYYHIDDPVISVTGPLSDEDIRSSIMKKLKLEGIVSSDPEVLRLMDDKIDSDPCVLPVSMKKNGEVTSKKQVLSPQDLNVLSEYVSYRIKETGSDIMSGSIAIPEPDGKTRFTGPDCAFCPYLSVCGHGGGEMKPPSDMKDEDWIRLMRQEEQ